MTGMQIFRAFLSSPTRATVGGFLFFILVGTFFLMMPQASNTHALGFVDALFTSTSAVCVTGLTVVDTHTQFTLFGQIVIIILIQIGGLGIMTVSTILILIARKRPRFVNYHVIQSNFTPNKERSISSILKDIVVFTLVLEGIGATFLFFSLCFKSNLGQALFSSIFHAISAFCNAGFSLFSDSFVGYKTNWGVNLTICFLVITGGIGFPVLSELKQSFSLKGKHWRSFTLHTKLVLVTTAILLITSTLFVVGMEWENTLVSLSVPNKFLAAFFQAVNARTSGFNSLPIHTMANETLFVLIIFMFIGASPGSCGGGVKTTSLASLAILAISRFKGYERPHAFGRSISAESIGQAVSIFLVSTTVICIGLMTLLITELGHLSHIQSRGKFLEIFFEVVSAFGTVGLSTGITPHLSIVGKLIITHIMFIGRLGPLVVVAAISSSTSPRFSYAEENIMI